MKSDHYHAYKWQTKDQGYEVGECYPSGKYPSGGQAPVSLKKLTESGSKYEIEVTYFIKNQLKVLFTAKKIFYMKLKNRCQIDPLLSEINTPFPHPIKTFWLEGQRLECIDPVCEVEEITAKKYLREQKLTRILR